MRTLFFLQYMFVAGAQQVIFQSFPVLFRLLLSYQEVGIVRCALFLTCLGKGLININ